MNTWAAIAKSAATRSGAPAGVLLSQYLERLCVVIRRAGARAVLQRRVAETELQRGADAVARDLFSALSATESGP